MLEAQLTQLLITTIKAGMTRREITANVVLADQPRQQGIPSDPTIFIEFNTALPVGWPGKRTKVNLLTNQVDKKTVQRLETRVKIFALAPQTPGNPDAPKAADYAGIVQRSLQDDETISALAAQKVGIRHTEALQTLYFSDDKVQNEANPWFEIILSHADVFITSAPGIIKITPNTFQGI